MNNITETDTKCNGMSQQKSMDTNLSQNEDKRQSAKLVVEEDVEDNGNDDEGGFWIFKLILVVIAFVALWILCPSDNKIRTEVAKTMAMDTAELFLGDAVDLIDEDDIDENKMVEWMGDEGVLEIKNFLIFKLAYFDPHHGKKGLAAIGVCGFVITHDNAPKSRAHMIKELIDS